MRQALMIGLISVFLLSASLSAAAQTPACATPDWQSEALVEYAKKLATATSGEYAETREVYRLPAVAASEVVLVDSDSTCRAAAAAYNREVEGSNPDRAVFVVRVGTVYIVVDPTYHTGEFGAYMIFNATFDELLESFTG